MKIAPDLAPEGLEAVIGVCLARKVSGLIVSNTTIARPDTLRGAAKTETGGLSGAPLLAPSTAMLAQAYRLAGGKLMLIGVGGIFYGGGRAGENPRRGQPRAGLYRICLSGPADDSEA